MVHLDYIIVGGGFAGFFFAHQLLKNNKSFIIFDGSQGAGSHVAAGVCNPVILKRFSTFWKSCEQMDFLDTVFSEIESYSQKNYIINEPVARIFHDENEKFLWLKNSNKENLKPFLDINFINLKSVENSFDTGIVKNSCRIDVENFFKDLTQFFHKKRLIVNQSFNYSSINLTESTYEEYKFNHIVFCEGVHVKNNPYFSSIPVLPNKGHCLEIKIDKPIDSFIIKKKHFLFSLSKDRYYYGGTYDRFNLSEDFHSESVDELKYGVETFFKGDYSIDNVRTGFRATVDDRRPILGTHLEFKNLHIFNGLGARGVLNGSFFSKVLFDYLEKNSALDPEINVNRFY